MGGSGKEDDIHGLGTMLEGRKPRRCHKEKKRTEGEYTRNGPLSFPGQQLTGCCRTYGDRNGSFGGSIKTGESREEKIKKSGVRKGSMKNCVSDQKHPGILSRGSGAGDKGGNGGKTHQGSI